ncbi:nucleotidyltransferase family protein [Cecembia sp.]|uniref:nucleotidyltransferase family protein n=1 Tax=Cecembia sp. TaxID=1898110 RepID=UPI0025BAE7BA|nr:nucleotidyltransferase family protein [Cecembia sp.]
MRRMSMDKKKIGVVILAAGGSLRLGEPKQLLNFRGKSLLENAIMAAENSECCCFVLVLGGNEDLIKRKLNFGQIPLISNPDWEKGMSGSLQLGLSYLQQSNILDAVLLMLADQPYVDHLLLNQMIRKFSMTNKEIVACAYNGTLGVPCIFGKTFFPDLFALSQQEGAKKIIQIHKQEAAVVEYPLAAIDIDTWEDYAALLKME